MTERAGLAVFRKSEILPPEPSAFLAFSIRDVTCCETSPNVTHTVWYEKMGPHEGRRSGVLRHLGGFCPMIHWKATTVCNECDTPLTLSPGAIWEKLP